MNTNAKVSLAVIVGALTIILLAVLAFFSLVSLRCAQDGPQANATLAHAEGANLSQASQLLHQLRQELEHSAKDLAQASQQLAASRNQTHTLKENLTEQLLEVHILTQQVFNLSRENQKLQDDILALKQNASSHTVELQEAKESREDLQRQNEEYQEKIKQLEALTGTKGRSSHPAESFSMITLVAVALFPLWA